jgi:hypothetical protein
MTIFNGPAALGFPAPDDEVLAEVARNMSLATAGAVGLDAIAAFCEVFRAVTPTAEQVAANIADSARIERANRPHFADLRWRWRADPPTLGGERAATQGPGAAPALGGRRGPDYFPTLDAIQIVEVPRGFSVLCRHGDERVGKTEHVLERATVVADHGRGSTTRGAAFYCPVARCVYVRWADGRPPEEERQRFALAAMVDASR